MGELIGNNTEAHGELVFTTSPSGYLKSITDPSYTGQILIFSFPFIGSYGIDEVGESARPRVRGVVVNHIPELFKEEISDYLKKWGVPGIVIDDSRKIIDFIRVNGNRLGSIGEKIFEDPYKVNLVREATAEKEEGNGDILLIDLGYKGNIIKFFQDYSLQIVPYNLFSPRRLSKFRGIIISNGPGDPSHAGLQEFTQKLRLVLGSKPVLGICLGHQLVALSLGLKTEKMKFGHRSINHPVEDLVNNRIGITTHNHGFTIIFDESKGAEERYRSLNDRSNEGLQGNNFLTTQFHPEGGPGPLDELGVFSEFKRMIEDE